MGQGDLILILPMMMIDDDTSSTTVVNLLLSKTSDSNWNGDIDQINGSAYMLNGVKNVSQG